MNLKCALRWHIHISSYPTIKRDAFSYHLRTTNRPRLKVNNALPQVEKLIMSLLAVVKSITKQSHDTHL